MNGRDGGGVRIILFSEVMPFGDNVSTILADCKLQSWRIWNANGGIIAAILDIAFKMAATINVPLSFR